MADNLKPVSLIEACDELGFDIVEVNNDTTGAIKRRITGLINFADKYLQGAIGQNYPVEDERAKQMALLIISDLYYRELDNKKITGITQKMLNDLELQLKAELRGKNA